MTRKRLIIAIVVLITLLMVGIASADQIILDPEAVLEINVTEIGHYTLTLKTNVDPIGGYMSWVSDSPLIWAGIDAAPTGQSGTKTITTSSTCSGSGNARICTQIFDLQVEPQSGITLYEQHDVTVTYSTVHGVARAMATASDIPIPELGTSILTATGLIGLIGLVRSRRKD